MITLKNLTQGSNEWLEVRLENFTASEASSMMGESKFMSRNQLLALKKGWQSNPIDSFKKQLFQKGHDYEELAREMIEAEIEDELYPIVGSVNIGKLKLLASFDGLTCDHVTVWEHKTWNDVLAENVRNNVLEPMYYWQLEHQLLVSGADKCIFTVSDGTPNKLISMDYLSIPERREALISGWVQFEKDLAEYQVEAVKESVIADKAESFPLITFEVTGTQISSNITDCLNIIKSRSQFEMTRVLETDQDFADKDQLNKATKKARSDLKSLVEDVQGKFVSYSEFATIAAEIDSVLQKMQSHGEKQVKQAKEAKKRDIEQKADQQIIDHSSKINKEIEPIMLQQFFDGMPDFAAAMKNKRTIESLQNAVDEVVAKFKIESNQIAEKVKVNLTTLRELASDHKFLFSDTPQLVTKDNEDLVAVIKTRIADHQKSEHERLEKEREQIRLEEEKKAIEKVDAIKQNAEETIEKLIVDISSPQVKTRQPVVDTEERVTQEEISEKSSITISIDLVKDIQEWATRYELPLVAVEELKVILDCHTGN